MNLPPPVISLPPNFLLIVFLQTSSTPASLLSPGPLASPGSFFPPVCHSCLVSSPSSPPPVNSYGDDDSSSSSGSEEEVQKQFEISVSRSQSFRVPKSGETQTRQVSVSRRQKFSRLSDQEEGSTEPSEEEGVTLKRSCWNATFVWFKKFIIAIIFSSKSESFKKISSQFSEVQQ